MQNLADLSNRGGGYRNYQMNGLSQIRLIQEVNGEEIKDQDKDIEIERLQTTCDTLNNRVSIAED
jgi:Zn-dependent M16 (insulinase) family peptidase